METEFNGSCLFNNVAIAAQHAIDKHKVRFNIEFIDIDFHKLFRYQIERVLIVDYDVHHGQGTQRHFYDDPRVLYFSAHRFEYGQCFPNLPESDYDAIGGGKGAGFNFNVPLNKVGMTNADYLAIWQQLLIPVAAEVLTPTCRGIFDFHFDIITFFLYLIVQTRTDHGVGWL